MTARVASSAAAVSLDKRPARASLAKMIVRLLERWGLSARDQGELLGLGPNPRATLQRYRTGQPMAHSRDLLERAGHLLAVHESLRILYPYNPEIRDAWMQVPNGAFGGRAPLDIVKERGFEGLLMVRRLLDVRRGL